MWKQFHTRPALELADTALFAKMNLEPVAGRGCWSILLEFCAKLRVKRGLLSERCAWSPLRGVHTNSAGQARIGPLRAC